MLHIKENQNLCIQLVKVNLQSFLQTKYFFVILDLTPPISGDLADKFRQTIILVSDQSISVKKKKENLLNLFFFAF